MVAGAVIGSLLALLLVATLVAVLLTRGRRQQGRGFPSSGDSLATGSSGGSNGADYGNKARLLFGGGGKNGTGANNNGPVYTYREGCDATGTLTEKPNNFHHHHHHLHHTSTGNPPTAHDILLCGDVGEAERRKFQLDDSMEEEEEQYDRFVTVGGGGNMLPPAYHPHRAHGGEAEMDVYLDDDMESQRDGSVISRTAIYV